MTDLKRYLLPLLISIFLLIRLVGLGYDMSNSDAGRWHRRSENFLNALKSGNFKETYQRYHPGVTLMWTNAFVKHLAFKYQLTFSDEIKTLENADYFPIIDGISKTAIIFVLAILLIFQFKFIKILFNEEIAHIYVFLVAVEPYLIGINRWFHQTSLEVFFAFSAFLAILVWHKLGSKKYLVVSPLFLAFSILAKFTTLITLPIIFLIFAHKWYKTKNLSVIKDALIFGLLTLLFVFIFFPALWVSPVYVFNKVYASLSAAVSNDIRGTLIPPIMQPVYYFVILLFKLSPITLALFFVTLLRFKKISNFYSNITFLYFLSYYVFLSIPEQKIDRYSLAFFLPILLLVSVFINSLSSAKKRLIFVASAAFLLFVIYMYHPVYSAYYSPIFGGTNRALALDVYDNSGEYFAQAAFYLNEKGRNKYVYVPNNIESFSYYYKGNLQRDFDDNTNHVLRSLDMGRTQTLDSTCPTLEAFFGPKDAKVVFVFICN